MAPITAQLPIDRIVEKYGVSEGKGFLRNRAWANVQRGTGEGLLSPNQLGLLDALTAYHCFLDESGKRPLVYGFFALQVPHVSEDAAGVWLRLIEQDIASLKAVGGDISRLGEDEGDYYDRFYKTAAIDDLSKEEIGLVLDNFAVLFSAGEEAGQGAFAMFDNEVASDMFKIDHNPFGPKLEDEEKAEAVAILKLTAAWPVEDEDEREELRQFAIDRPEDADAAVAILSAEPVASVEDLITRLDAVEPQGV